MADRCTAMTKGKGRGTEAGKKREKEGEKRGVKSLRQPDEGAGWWTEAVSWLGLVGCNGLLLFQKPCSDGGQDDTARIFLAIHSVCVCVGGLYVWERAHMFRGHTTGNRDADSVRWGHVSRQPRGNCYNK